MFGKLQAVKFKSPGYLPVAPSPESALQDPEARDHARGTVDGSKDSKRTYQFLFYALLIIYIISGLLFLSRGQKPQPSLLYTQRLFPRSKQTRFDNQWTSSAEFSY
jgi:hypothetical protein